MAMNYTDIVKRPHTLRQLTGMSAEEFQRPSAKLQKNK